MNILKKNWNIVALVFTATYVILSFYYESEPTMKERAYIGKWKSKKGQIEIRKEGTHLIFLEKDKPPHKAILINSSALLVPIKKDSVLSIYKTNKEEMLVSGVGFFKGERLESDYSHIAIMDIIRIISLLALVWVGYVIYDIFENRLCYL